MELKELDSFSLDEKFDLAKQLLVLCQDEATKVQALVKALCSLLPKLATDKKYGVLMKLTQVLHENAQKILIKDTYGTLDASVFASLQPLELISLANQMVAYLECGSYLSRELAMWGLMRLIPYMYDVNQKEFAQEIYVTSSESYMRSRALDVLTDLIFSLKEDDRLGMCYFFADVIKSNEDYGAKTFTIELLGHVAQALRPRERSLVADCIAPALYFSDIYLARAALEYFAETLPHLPENERYHYLQMVAALTSDVSLRLEAVAVVDRSLPLLTLDNERNTFLGILENYSEEVSISRGDSAPFEDAVLYSYRR
jgi:hypothetical protein